MDRIQQFYCKQPQHGSKSIFLQGPATARYGYDVGVSFNDGENERPCKALILSSPQVCLNLSHTSSIPSALQGLGPLPLHVMHHQNSPIITISLIIN